MAEPTVWDRVQETIAHLRQRKRNYQLALTSPAGQEVLIDLAKFCRANVSCFHPDPRLHALAEGRREVWLRIQNHLGLSEAELFALYTGAQYNTNPDAR